MEVDDSTLVIEVAPVPLEVDADGVVRVGGTRVTLDTIVDAFQVGATAEEIVHKYPSLDLADVYSVISFYLQRQPDVEAYLRGMLRLAADENLMSKRFVHTSFTISLPNSDTILS